MTEMQKRLFNMFKWFDSFCRDNNLIYYAVGGTLLGAVRHEGFIPWDDDIDVGMPRKDYELLTTKMGTEIQDHYILETVHSMDKSYCYTFSKLYDTNTTLVENVRSKLKRGIYIDVFPIDGIGKGNEPDLEWYHKIKLKKSFYLSRITGIRKGRSAIKNLSVLFSRLIPNLIINDKKLREKIDQIHRILFVI